MIVSMRRVGSVFWPYTRGTSELDLSILMIFTFTTWQYKKICDTLVAP